LTGQGIDLERKAPWQQGPTARREATAGVERASFEVKELADRIFTTPT